MKNERLFNIGVYLVKFAWVVEIIAVLIGLLISIIVSYSVYTQLNITESEMTFSDYSAVLVAGLPFFLVAIVEASKIPVATALMYAKHTRWRIILFIGLVLLATITFETMMNGFERNFSNLTVTIDERKNDELLIQHKIDILEEKKRKIDIISPTEVEAAWNKRITRANKNFNERVSKQREFIEAQINALSKNDMNKFNDEIALLSIQENEIYKSWDKERDELRNRVRGLINQNIKGSTTDKEKLTQEIKELKKEMKKELSTASFLTKYAIQENYQKQIEKKEKRLYAVTDYAVGTNAIQQQTKSEEQLQEYLKIIGKNFQARIDTVRSRIDYLNNKIKKHQESNKFLEDKYRNELNTFTSDASNNRQVIVTKAFNDRKSRLTQYEKIQTQIQSYDEQIFKLIEKQRQIHHGINKLVNQNQIYRVATYVSNSENAIDVPHDTVGLVALVWFASLAFICALAGVFLAIAGIYIQRLYSGEYDIKD